MSERNSNNRGLTDPDDKEDTPPTTRAQGKQARCKRRAQTDLSAPAAGAPRLGAIHAVWGASPTSCSTKCARAVQRTGLSGPLGQGPAAQHNGILWIVPFFIFFIFVFKKIYFRFENLQKYTPAAPLPGSRDLAARQPGGRGLSAKKVDKKLRRGPWRTGPRQRGGRPSSPPGRGAAGPGRPPAGRLAPQLYIRCWLPLTPSFVSLKIQKKRKEREGEER